MKEFALEAALFDEPSGAKFVAVVAAIDGVTLVFSDFSFGAIEINIMEEGTGRGLFHGVGKFVSADDGNDVADAFRAEVGEVVLFEVFFDGIVKGAFHLTFS